MAKKQPSNRTLLKNLFNLIVDKDSKYIGNPKDFASLFWDEGSPDIGVSGKDGTKLHIGKDVKVTDEIIARVIAVIPNPDEIPAIFKTYAKDMNNGVLKGTKFSIKADGRYLRIFVNGILFATVTENTFDLERKKEEINGSTPLIDTLLNVIEWVDTSERVGNKYVRQFNKYFNKRGIKIKDDGEVVLDGKNVDDRLLIDTIFYFYPEEPTLQNIAEFVAMMNGGPLEGPDYLRLALTTDKNGEPSEIEVIKMGKVITRYWNDGEEYEDLEDYFPLYKTININSDKLKLLDTSNRKGGGNQYQFLYKVDEEFSKGQLIRFYIDDQLVLVISLSELMSDNKIWYTNDPKKRWSIMLANSDYSDKKKGNKIKLKSVNILLSQPW